MIIFLSVLAAFLQSTKDAIAKKLALKLDPYTLSIGVNIGITTTNLLILLVNILIKIWKNRRLGFDVNLALSQEFSSLNLNTIFWVNLIALSLLFAVANVCMYIAFRISDLSVTVPILSFVPIFTLILEIFFLGYVPNLIFLIGVAIVVFGSYFLKLGSETKNFFAPFQALLSDRGVWLMLVVTVVYALDNLLSKFGTESSSSYLWSIFVTSMMALFTLPFALLKNKKILQSLKENFSILLFIGFVMGIGVTLNHFLFTQASITLVTTVARTSSIFSLVYGLIWFKEKNIFSKSIGVFIMIFGITLISLNLEA